ncbi:thioredoxin-like protein [Fennellomyces sp. T-0311]|nr:thioredoxin-like protein [Fennellomyces sp. T-0311]
MANTAEELASVLILYTKFFTFCMVYWKSGMFKSILYLAGWMVLSTLFPQPWYQGPTKIVELSENTFREEVQRKRSSDGPRITEITDENRDVSSKSKGKGKATQFTKYWVVMLYANWSLACLNFEAVLAKLSLQYGASHIKFGKIDIDIYPDLADEYGISRDPASFDLPTLLLFRDGAQIRRLPELTGPDDSKPNKAAVSAKDTITRIGWSKKGATVVKAFHLDKIFTEK